MKIFATSDLHISEANSTQFSLLKYKVEKENPDVIVICGDIYDTRAVDPFSELATLGKPVVFCLGNHEFAYQIYGEVIDRYACLQMKYLDKQVYCLDVLPDGVEIDNVKFAGNVLWYDGSLSERPDVENKLKNIDKNWLDRTIERFDAKKENAECVNLIKRAMTGWNNKRSVLVTHTVPYWKLNQFSYDTPFSTYNIYSGMKDLFKTARITPAVAFCGHTHRKSRVEYRDSDKSVLCVNIGNDYFKYSNHFEYEVFFL